MKMISYFVIAYVGCFLITSASAYSDVMYHSSDSSKGSISTYIIDPNHENYGDRSFEYKQAQVYFDSIKTDLFNSKIESLNDSPPAWPWGHSIGGTYYNFGGTKWVEIKPGPSVEEPENSLLNVFPGLKLNNIWY